MAFYVLMGNMIAALGVMDYLTQLLAKGPDQIRKDMLFKSLGHADNQSSHEPFKAHAKNLAPLITAFLGVLSMILLGTFFFSYVDYCVCDEFQSCDVVILFSEREKCEDAGGRERSVIESFYMSCVTLTTIGFGDLVPGNWLGRLFATYWMVAGVAAQGYFLGQLARAIQMESVKKGVLQGMTAETFHMIDADNSGSLSEYEYIVYMLLNFNMIEAEDVQGLSAAFAKLDLDGSGTLEYNEVRLHHHHHHDHGY